MKEKINSNQVLSLALAVIIPTIILLIPRIIVSRARQMGWLTIIIAGSSTAILYYICLKLSLDYSNNTLTSDLKSLFGPILGKLILIPFIVFNLDVANYVLYEGVSFVGVIMPKTPMIIFWLALTLLATYLVYQGIEVLGRISELGMIIIFLSLMFIVVYNFIYNFAEVGRLEPLIININKLTKVSLLPAYWFMLPLTMLLVLKPYFKDKHQVLKISLLSNVLTQILVVALTLVLIVNFGTDLASRLSFPFYELSKFSVRGFEVIILVAWLTGVILKLAIYLFISAELLAQTFELKTYKKLVTPIAIIIASFGIFRTKYALPILNLKYFIVGYLLLVQVPFVILLSLAYLLNKKN